MFALLHSLAMFVIDFFKLPRWLEAENLRSRRRICSARWTRSRLHISARNSSTIFTDALQRAISEKRSATIPLHERSS